jgi:hypothetical protein
LKPAILTGRPSVDFAEKGMKNLAGFEIAYRPGGHGMKIGGGWGAHASFELRHDGKIEKRGLFYEDDTPGELAEIIAFGEAFEISWRKDMTVTHIGKARTKSGCFEAMEREVAAIGLTKKPREPDDPPPPVESTDATNVSSIEVYDDWIVYCAEQSLRVWVARKQPRRNMEEGRMGVKK